VVWAADSGVEKRQANRVPGQFRQMLTGSDEILARQAGKATDHLGVEAGGKVRKG